MLTPAPGTACTRLCHTSRSARGLTPESRLFATGVAISCDGALGLLGFQRSSIIADHNRIVDERVERAGEEPRV